MNEVFTFQEKEIYELRSGIHCANRRMHAIDFGIDTNLGISNLGTKIWKLVLDKIKLSKTQHSVFKSYVKSWSIDNCFGATKILP